MENSRPLNIRIIRGSSTILLFTFLTSPIAYLIRVLYSHTLSVEMYGLFYAVVSLFLLLAAYNDLGFGYSVSFLVPKFLKKGDLKSSWNIYKYEQLIEISTSVFLSIILVLSANWLSTVYFKSPLATNLIYILSIYFISNSFIEAINKFFQGLQQELYYSSIQFSKQLFTLVFSVFFWFLDSNPILYFALSWAIAGIAVAIIYNILLRRKNRFVIKGLSWDKALFTSMYQYAIPTLLITSFSSFIIYSDTIFLTYFKGLREVGIYNIALPLASISAVFLSPLNRFFLPLVSHLMEGDSEKIHYILKMVLKITPFIGLYFSLFLFLFPSAPILILFGSKWVGLVELPLLILVFGYIPLSLGNYLGTVLSGAGKVKELLKASFYLSIAIIFLSLLLIPRYGAAGAALANTITYLLMVLLYGSVLKSLTKFKYPVLFYSQLISFSLALIALVKLTHISPNTFFQYIIFGILYSFLFLLFGYKLGVVNKDTLKLFLHKK